MSEELLKAVLRLFALIARIDGFSARERERIEKFLYARLNRESAEKYMALFDRYVREEEELNRKDEMERIRVLSNKINTELTVQQKFFLILELTLLVYADQVLTENEERALGIIGEALYIPSGELDDIKAFVMAGDIGDFNPGSVLIIKKSETGIPPAFPRIIAEGMEGWLAVLNLPSIKPFFVRYQGPAAVYLNQVLLDPGSIEVLSSGGTLRIEKSRTIYYSDLIAHFKVDDMKVRVCLRAEKVYYRFKDGRYGLHDITLHETHGRLVGIVGASGSGKSTLFNVLNGNERPTSGKVFINDIDIHKHGEMIQGLIGYVPQDDLLLEDLTVYENLYFNARLCFDQYSRDQLDRLVNRILLNLGLSEVRNMKVGSSLNKMISGGQRKRLNIGLELLREPPILFVDEPTSGLSSRDSENIMDLLKELTLRGKLIFVVIHQPSSNIFKMFDRLLVLDKGGYLIYYGNPVESLTYFKRAFNLVDPEAGACPVCGNINPEQIFNIVDTRVVDEYGRPTGQRKVTPETWYDIYKKGEMVEEKEDCQELPEVLLNIPGKIKQAWIYALRDIRAKMRNKQYVVINLLEAPLLASILAVLVRYYPTDTLHHGSYFFKENLNVPAYIFMAIVVALFMGLSVSAEEIIKDRKVLKRESFLNLSWGSYLSSKLMILLVLSAFQTMTFVLIGNLILSIRGLTFEYWAVLFTTSFFANILGLNISSAFNSAVTIYILIPILLIPQILLSGVVVQFDQLNPIFGAQAHVPFIGDLMASRWGYEAIMVTQYKDNAYEKQFYDLDKRIANSDYMTMYYLPVLESIVDYLFINNHSRDEKIRSSMQQQAVVLRNEIEKALEMVGKDQFTGLDSLECCHMNQSLYHELTDFLRSLKRMYQLRHKKALDEKEAKIARLCDTPEKTRAYQDLIREYTNDQVTTMVLNKRSVTRVLEDNGRLVQKIYPVYTEPEPDGYFDYRAVFYAPVKYFAGRYYNVLSFNIAVIWLMSFLLTVFLYFKLLRKLIHGKGKTEAQ